MKIKNQLKNKINKLLETSLGVFGFGFVIGLIISIVGNFYLYKSILELFFNLGAEGYGIWVAYSMTGIISGVIVHQCKRTHLSLTLGIISGFVGAILGTIVAFVLYGLMGGSF